MKRTLIPWLLWLACLAPLPASAIDSSEVRVYDEVFTLSASAPDAGHIELRWIIAEGYYLYNNRFLRFESLTPGVVLGEAVIPPGEKKFDELLGEEVIKYHEQLQIALPLVSMPPGTREVELQVQSQGCLEAVLCYPPTLQTVRVSLPSVLSGLGSLVPGQSGQSGQSSQPGHSVLEQTLGDSESALPPDQAFVYEAIGLSAETILVRFTAQPGYYLYVDKLAFRVLDAPGIQVREVSLPAGTVKDDPEFGPVPVIYDQVEIPVRLTRPAGPATEVQLQADFQGCRDGDICYPPQQATVRVQLAAAATALGDSGDSAEASTASGASPAQPRSEQGRLAGLLLERPLMALLAFFLAGLLLAFTPCVFPMVPILSGIIAGEGARITPRRAFWLSLVYVLAMALTYTAAGVLAGLFGKNLQAAFQEPWVILAFVTVFIVLALSMFGLFELQLPARWQTALTESSNRLSGGRLSGVAVMGLLSALIVGPCVAPPLAAALIVIGESGSPLLGGSALFALSLGMGVPLLAFGTAAGRFLPHAGAWMKTVTAVFGVGLLALAIWMLERIWQGPIILFLWGVLAIGCAVFLRVFERLPEGAGGWQRLGRALGLILLVLGAAELAGAAAGGNNWLRPLAQLGRSGGSEAAEVHFTRIKSLADLQTEVAAAGATGQPAMLDFYADWCVECIRMERNVFPEPEVRQAMSRFKALQADVTANDAIDQALMREFGIIGPPAILFFGMDGQELRDYRLVGYFPPAEFLRHLADVQAAVEGGP